MSEGPTETDAVCETDSSVVALSVGVTVEQLLDENDAVVDGVADCVVEAHPDGVADSPGDAEKDDVPQPDILEDIAAEGVAEDETESDALVVDETLWVIETEGVEQNVALPDPVAKPENVAQPDGEPDGDVKTEGVAQPE